MKLSDDNRIRGLNSVGLRRGGIPESDVEALQDATRALFGSHRPIAAAIDEFASNNRINPHVKHLIDFLRRRDLGKHGRYLESLRK